MSPDEFAARAVGMPWVRWRSDWQAADCFGLVVLYFREVLGVDLGAVPQTDIADGFSRAQGWEECGPEPGTTAFMAWEADAPTHCGVVLPGGLLLHSQQGADGVGGGVRATRLPAMARLFTDLRFYRYSRC